MKHQITIGCDPEVFFKKDNLYFPAIGLVGGTKNNPRKCGIGHVQEDNVMPEFNIPPSTTAIKFSNNIQAMLDELNKIAEKHGCTIDYTSFANFDERLLLHPQARTIGCDPDFNAWTKTQNIPADPDVLGTIRTASGHVHIGVPDPNSHPSFRASLAIACDLFLGIPGMFKEKEDNIRRKFYGRAGCFRPKSYGIEYRVLGNWWITEDKYRKWVFNQSIQAISKINDVLYWLNRGHFSKELAEACINNKDLTTAKKLCDKFSIGIP